MSGRVTEGYILDLKERAVRDGVPIIGDEAWDVLRECIAAVKPGRVLEIGTAVGYSAVRILSEISGGLISVELDPIRHAQAVANLAAVHGGRDYTLICGDAGEVLKGYAGRGEMFDLVFMDGPKGQYINYYPYAKQLLRVGGIMFCDNVFFHGLAGGTQMPPHKNRSMLLNLRKFVELIKSDSDMRVEITDGDEAVAVCTKLR